MRKNIVLGCTIAACILLQGCANTLKYDDETAAVTVTTDVNSEDLKSSAELMVQSMLDDNQVRQAIQGRRPVLAVFGVIDFSNDQMDLAGINGNILNTLHRSNRFRFSSAEQLINENRRLNANLYDLVEQPDTAQLLASSMNADFLFIGEVSKVIRNKPTRKQVYYRMTLKLLSSKSGKFIWQDQSEMLHSEKAIIYGI